MEQDLQQAIEK